MDSVLFEQMALEVFESLPPFVRARLENVHVVVEDLPSDDLVREMKLRSKSSLLGLYQGVPLKSRGTAYGSSPVVPDRITLFKTNIERSAGSRDLREMVREVLIHEIGHHFGMTEEELRQAGY
jgi:predicted Zn-dependent protease with MMP-like domain